MAETPTSTQLPDAGDVPPGALPELPPPSLVRGLVAGALAGGVALGVGELIAGMIDGVPSLVTAVGQALIPFVPASVETWAIETFGTSDKFVLNTGTTMLTLAVAAWSGTLALRSLASAAPVWVAVALIGIVTGLGDGLTNPALTILAVALAGGAGFGALWLLAREDHNARTLQARVDRIRSAGLEADREQWRRAAFAAGMARRRFLAVAGGAGLAGMVTAFSGRSLTLARGQAFDEVRDFSLPDPVRPVDAIGPEASFDLDGITPIVQPTDDFYRIDTRLTIPRIAPDTWELKVTGMVDRELTLRYDDLLDRDLVEAYVTLSCVSNEIGGDLVGNARWLGYPLQALLEEAGVQAGAEQVVGRAVDGWTAGFPVELAMDGRDALVAVGMNGEPLPPRHGFPARLVVPGLYGYVSATKWLAEIELTTWDGFDGYWIPRGWSKEGPVKTQSRIDVPRRNAQVVAGPTAFGGIAWAPHRGIAAVEVRLNEGEWHPATLSSPLSDDAWVQWMVEIDVPAGRHVAEVRATDATGEVQGEDWVPPRPDGAEGYHAIRITAV